MIEENWKDGFIIDRIRCDEGFGAGNQCGLECFFFKEGRTLYFRASEGASEGKSLRCVQEVFLPKNIELNDIELSKKKDELFSSRMFNINIKPKEKLSCYVKPIYESNLANTPIKEIYCDVAKGHKKYIINIIKAARNKGGKP